MSSESNTSISEIYHIAKQLQRMNYLGSIQTFQIEFDYLTEDTKSKLEGLFTDSTTLGKFKADMIILEQISGRDSLEIIETLSKIHQIFGDLSVIDGIAALIEINYHNDSYFVVVSYNPKTDGLELISTSESKLYFELLNYVRTKWALSSKFV